MQPARWARTFLTIGTLWLVVAGVALAGCSPAGNVTLPGTGPLLTVRVHGGMCMDGACDNTIVLERDGRVHDTDPPDTDLGRVDNAAMAALTGAMGSADFTALKARPFTGECPVAFDGQELVFTFNPPGISHTLASCEVEIDWSNPLFVAVGAALGEWIPLPLM